MKYINEDISDHHYIPTNLKEMIAFWQGRLASVPEEIQENVVVEYYTYIDAYGDSALDVKMEYYRPYTEEEKLKKEKKKALALEDRQAYVREQIERLQGELK